MDCSLPGSSVHGFVQARNWSELPFPSPGDLPHTGIRPMSPTWQADSLPLSHLCGGVLQRRVKNYFFLPQQVVGPFTNKQK